MITTETPAYVFTREKLAQDTVYTRALWQDEIARLEAGGVQNSYSAEWLTGYTTAQGVLLEQLRNASFPRQTLIAGLKILLLIGGNGSEHNEGYLSAVQDVLNDLQVAE